MKRILPLIFGAVLYGIVTLAASHVAAQNTSSTLVLEKIGTSTFNSGSTSWTYYGTNPVFQGTASASTSVSLSVDGVSETSVTSDSTGEWSITPTSLDSVGNYDLVFSSGAEEISFTLSLASSSSTTTSTTKGGTTSGEVDLPETLPETGSEDIFLLLGIGGVMIAAGISSGLLLRD